MKEMYFISKGGKYYKYCLLILSDCDGSLDENSDFYEMVEDFQSEYGEIEILENEERYGFLLREIEPDEIKSATNHFINFLKEIDIKIKSIYFSEKLNYKPSIDEILEQH